MNKLIKFLSKLIKLIISSYKKNSLEKIEFK